MNTFNSEPLIKQDLKVQNKLDNFLKKVDIEVIEEDIIFTINTSTIVFKENGDVVVNSGKNLYLNSNEEEGIKLEIEE